MNINRSDDQPGPVFLVDIESQLALSHHVLDEIEAWQLARTEGQQSSAALNLKLRP